MSSKKKKSELSLVGKSLEVLPAKVGEFYGYSLKKLDLSSNQIQDFSNFEGLVKLETLIMDKNGLTEMKGFPSLPTVTTLWLNNNKISNLDKALEVLADTVPNLTYLSMLRNPCVPNIYEDFSKEKEYYEYRNQVIRSFPKLEYIDAQPITPEDKIAAASTSKPSTTGTTEQKQPKQDFLTDDEQPQSATFFARGAPRQDGKDSEGNRFITNDDL